MTGTNKLFGIIKPAVLGCLATYFIIVCSNIIFKTKQWDLMPYYYGAKVYFEKGGDPYDLKQLTLAAAEEVNNEFIYPPYTLYLFRPLLHYNYQTAYFVWFGLKLMALFFLLFVWKRLFLNDSRYDILLFLFAALAFREAIIKDLYTGNVNIFEQLAIWSGVYYFRKGKAVLFAIFIVLSALFKITSIVFLLLLIVDRNWKSIITILAGSISLLLINFVYFVNRPLFLNELVHNALSSGAVRSGNTNPSSFALIRDIMSALRTLTGAGLHSAEVTVYAVYVIILLIITIYFTRRIDFSTRRMELVMLVMFIYALILPRFLNYSYVLLIIPAIFVVIKEINSPFVATIMTLLICVTFLPYQAYFMAIALFVLHLKFIRKFSATNGAPSIILNGCLLPSQPCF